MHLAMRDGGNDAYGRAAAARAERAAYVGVAVGTAVAAAGSIAWAANVRAHAGPILTLWGLAAVTTSTCVANTRSAFRGRNAELFKAMAIGARAAAGSGSDGEAEIIDLPQHPVRPGSKHAI